MPPKRKKKGVELWGSASIYRSKKSLKNRYGWLGFESGRILLQKGRKWCGYCHQKAVGPKHITWKFGPFRVLFGTPKVPNWLYGSEHSFMFSCRLDSSSRIFWLVLVPRCVFILRLWFFISFLDNLVYLRIIILTINILK